MKVKKFKLYKKYQSDIWNLLSAKKSKRNYNVLLFLYNSFIKNYNLRLVLNQKGLFFSKDLFSINLIN